MKFYESPVCSFGYNGNEYIKRKSDYSIKSCFLLPGAELLFKEINTTISDDDKNAIFLQPGI